MFAGAGGGAGDGAVFGCFGKREPFVEVAGVALGFSAEVAPLGTAGAFGISGGGADSIDGVGAALGDVTAAGGTLGAGGGTDSLVGAGGGRFL